MENHKSWCPVLPALFRHAKPNHATRMHCRCHPPASARTSSCPPDLHFTPPSKHNSHVHTHPLPPVIPTAESRVLVPYTLKDIRCIHVWRTWIEESFGWMNRYVVMTSPDKSWPKSVEKLQILQSITDCAWFCVNVLPLQLQKKIRKSRRDWFCALLLIFLFFFFAARNVFTKFYNSGINYIILQ